MTDQRETTTRVIDITCDFPPSFGSKVEITEIPIESNGAAYTGVAYAWPAGSMQGTYIDLPGHIKELDDGATAENFPVERLYRVAGTYVQLRRESGSGAVTAEDLQTALGRELDSPALVINVLGLKEPDEIETRSVYLDDSAVDWIIRSGVRLLVSDVYESQAIHGVFARLFAAGVVTVCEPRGMHRIGADRVFLTVLFEKVPVVTQIPCRAVVEIAG